MVPLSELKRIAAKQKIALGVVEKDYALTWALYALSETEFKKDRLFSPDRIHPAQEYWEKALAHQIDNLPDFKAVIEECKGLIHKFLKA